MTSIGIFSNSIVTASTDEINLFNNKSLFQSPIIYCDETSTAGLSPFGQYTKLL